MTAHQKLGDSYELNGQFDKALYHYTKVLEYPQSSQSKAFVLRKMGEIYQKKGDNAAALKQYKAGLAELVGTENSSEAAQILADIGYIYNLDGKHQEAIQMHHQVLEALESIKDHYVRAIVYKNLDSVRYERAELDQPI
jgi:tetratricopeptide (TPR) repeat protein